MFASAFFYVFTGGGQHAVPQILPTKHKSEKRDTAEGSAKSKKQKKKTTTIVNNEKENLPNYGTNFSFIY